MFQLPVLRNKIKRSHSQDSEDSSPKTQRPKLEDASPDTQTASEHSDQDSMEAKQQKSVSGAQIQSYNLIILVFFGLFYLFLN